MTREELRDKVARAIGESLRTARMSLESEGYLPEADAAIAIVLEEAAKVAEAPVETQCCNNPLWSGHPEDQPECCGKPEYRGGDPGEIAAAIRALIPSEVPPGAS